MQRGNLAYSIMSILSGRTSKVCLDESRKRTSQVIRVCAIQTIVNVLTNDWPFRIRSPQVHTASLAPSSLLPSD